MNLVEALQHGKATKRQAPGTFTLIGLGTKGLYEKTFQCYMIKDVRLIKNPIEVEGWEEGWEND